MMLSLTRRLGFKWCPREQGGPNVLDMIERGDGEKELERVRTSEWL